MPRRLRRAPPPGRVPTTASPSARPPRPSSTRRPSPSLSAPPASSHPIPVTLLSIAFLGWFIPACFTQVAMVTRAIMTWSFDGLLPRVFSKVDDRTHTPGVAILTTALLSIPLAAWISYSPNFFQYFAIAAVSAYPSLVLVGGAPMVITRRRSDLYRGSSAAWHPGGIEVLPVAGFLHASVRLPECARLFS